MGLKYKLFNIVRLSYSISPSEINGFTILLLTKKKNQPVANQLLEDA
jgi:hypothetical protein